MVEEKIDTNEKDKKEAEEKAKQEAQESKDREAKEQSERKEKVTSSIEGIDARMKRLEELNKVVDSKIATYNKLIIKAEDAGVALAGDAVNKEETKEERITREAKEMLKGTGLEDRI